MKFETDMECGGHRRTIPRKVQSLDLTEEPPRNIGEEMLQETYVLKTQIFVKFYSNRAQLNRKRAQAEKTMRAYLFKDCLPLVEELMLEAESSEVHKLASLLKSTMLGEIDDTQR